MKLFPFRTDFHNHVSIRASTRQARSSEYPDVAIGLVLALLIAQLIKNLPTVQKPWVQSLGWDDLLEKEMATHSIFLPRKSHGWRNLVGYSSWGRKELDMTEQLHFH